VLLRGVALRRGIPSALTLYAVLFGCLPGWLRNRGGKAESSATNDPVRENTSGAR